MFAAHTSIGYLTTKTIIHTTKTQSHIKTAYFAGILGSVFPDIDLFWFYTFGERAVHHHNYITHKPVVWLTISSLILGMLYIKQSKWLVVAACFLSNVFLHITVDTIVGKIHWLWPFVEGGTTLVYVPTKHDFWVWNFIDHWTFIPEIIIMTIALLVFIRSRLKARLG